MYFPFITTLRTLACNSADLPSCHHQNDAEIEITSVRTKPHKESALLTRVRTLGLTDQSAIVSNMTQSLPTDWLILLVGLTGGLSSIGGGFIVFALGWASSF